MGNLLFSLEGRINSAQFYQGGFVLILIMIVLNLVNLISPQLGQIAGLISYLLLYPWAVIWIKRLHDGGKNGWMFLVYLLLYFILSTVGFFIVLIYFGDSNLIDMIMQSVGGDISEAELKIKMQVLVKSVTLPAAIFGIITSLITMFIGDKTIPTNCGDNEYGMGYNTFD